MPTHIQEPSRVHNPGTMFWMPPYRGLPGDPTHSGHPHALIVPAEPARTCTLVYGSTSAAEEAVGGQCHLVQPQRTGVGHNGLSKATRFYTGVLSLRAYEDLPERRGWLGKEVPDLRKKLRRSLGVGKGCAGEAKHEPRSWRGRIVQLSQFVENTLGSDLGVLVTEPRYSAEQRYQVVVPIIDGTGVTEVVSPALRITSPPWVNLLGDEVTDAILLVPSTVSVRHTNEYIVSDTGSVLNRAHMDAIDEHLCIWFGLRLPTATEERGASDEQTPPYPHA